MASNSTIAVGLQHCAECGRDLPYLPLPYTQLTCPCGSEWEIDQIVPADAAPFLSIVQTEKSVDRGDTYVVIDDLATGRHAIHDTVTRYIMCLKSDCPAYGHASYNRNDIEQRYCGGCHTFHTRRQ